MEGDKSEKKRVHSYYDGYLHHPTAPKTRKEIAEHDAKVGAFLDAARADAGIAWDEMSTAHVCRMVPKGERK